MDADTAHEEASMFASDPAQAITYQIGKVQILRFLSDARLRQGAERHPAVSANPFISFTTVATRSGTLTFTWIGDNGFEQTETAAIEVG